MDAATTTPIPQRNSVSPALMYPPEYLDFPVVVDIESPFNDTE
jgi:hypothetical protein